MKKPIWVPSKERVESSHIFAYMNFINQRHTKNFKTYEALYDWSINHIPLFWESIWDFLGIRRSKDYDEVLIDGDKMPGAKWFVGAKLNFAENLLQYRDDHLALIFKGEVRETVRLTYAELYDSVARLAKSLREMGIRAGDRVVGFMPNIPETIIAMLASTSIGALWSSCSPDFGIKGVLDRFGQIEPKVIFTAHGYRYNGQYFDSLERITGIIKDLPSVEKVVIVPYPDEEHDINKVPHAISYNDFASQEDNLIIHFEQLPFDHPLYIMYSSGTTGLPKCLVQGAGGILINHMKELMLHTDLKREDKIFYFTTCGWMMWNWLVSSLAIGATIMLYDGSPFYPHHGALFTLAEDEKMTIFGTSARYLATIEKKGVKPSKEYNLDNLKALLSTGSPLYEDGFLYIYRHIKKDICLSSISGGTDLNGCFAAGNPMGPVYAGELQCRALGMKVEVFNENGKPMKGGSGELVCTAPFPSMPLYFWNDKNGEKYQKAYFDIYPNVWRHGDFIEITEQNGVIIHGRSDATLNPGGVRIGTAEIYRQVETINEVLDSLVIGHKWKNDIRIILFVKLANGVELTAELKKRIKHTIRDNTTPRHVPAKIIKIDDIPYTINMKKVELAVRDILHGKPVLNKDALINPEVLDLFKNLKELLY
ncbi:MAG: acetoacetate--CoA ligase [Thermodesulfobacteriota bacterium]|nr:acetoacetate--CoA ligase [Thermodesulfobacteriota bacterium]